MGIFCMKNKKTSTITSFIEFDNKNSQKCNFNIMSNIHYIDYCLDLNKTTMNDFYTIIKNNFYPQIELNIGIVTLNNLVINCKKQDYNLTMTQFIKAKEKQIQLKYPIIWGFILN